jgi:Arm DNA-binding domain
LLLQLPHGCPEIREDPSTEGLIVNLTTQSVAALSLPPGKNDQIWFDDTVPGFGLRLRQTGARSWMFQYKIGRATRRLVIGSAAAIKVARAREIAGQHHAAVKLGRDPAAEKRMQVERASHTFGALVERYLDRQRGELRPGSLREVKRHLETHSKPLHPCPLTRSTSASSRPDWPRSKRIPAR